MASGEVGGGSAWPESAPCALTRRRVRFRPPTKRRARPARGWDSSSGALRKVEDLLLAHLMVWSVSEKDFAGIVAGGEGFLTAIRLIGSFRRWEG